MSPSIPLSLLGLAALQLAEQSWQVFPLAPRSKIPTRDSHGFHDATDDDSQIRQWWATTPDANIGVSAGDLHEGGSGVWSLDFDDDPDKQKFGMQVRSELIETHGEIGGLELWTARGVQHVFTFDERSPTGPRSDVVPGVDVRSTGSYFLAPPSMHPSGTPYRWGSGKPVPAPNWLLTWMQNAQPFTTKKQAPSNGTRPLSPESIAEYRTMLSYIDGERRDRWLSVGFALYELGWGQPAFDLWDAWSRNWPARYSAPDQRAQWESFAREYNGRKLTIASVAALAKKEGWPHQVFSIGTDKNREPIPFFKKEQRYGPTISIDEVFGDAPRLRSYLHIAREYLQVPESTIALSHLTAISAACAKRVLFDNGKFTQPPPLWQMTLMRTGGRKSEIVDLIRDPFFEVASSPRAREQREKAMALQSLIMDRLVEEQKKAQPNREEIRRAKFELVKNRGMIIDLMEMVASDTTEAGLQTSLLESGGACFICDGEAATLNNAIHPIWAKTGAVPQTTTWLNAFSGKSIKVKRADKKRKQGLIKKPELAICLIVQSGSPTNYLFEHPHLRDSGFMARFLIDVPDFHPEKINVDAVRPDPRYSMPWRALVESYLLRGVPLEPQAIHFHQDAARQFLDWRRVHQDEFRDGGANNDLAEFHHKAQGTMTRVAGLIAVARSFERFQPGSAFVVESVDVERAIALFPSLVGHVRTAYGLDDDVAVESLALRVLRMVFHHWPGGVTFSARDVRRRGLRGARTEQIREGIRLLVETRWLAPDDEQRWHRGDPRCRFSVNPDAREADLPRI